MDNTQILQHIDHTRLAAVSTWEEIEALCRQALEWHTASVCIPPSFVRRVREAFPQLRICTVIGFPLGYSTTQTKVFETAEAVAGGADEVDMVVNLGDVKDGAFDRVTAEIAALKAAADGRVLKVIIETCALTDEEKTALCRCVTEGGADYIKTSTGFGTAGAKLEDITLFRQHIGPGVKIKAAGGIRTKEAMEAFLEAGCDRIGTSSAAALVSGEEQA